MSSLPATPLVEVARVESDLLCVHCDYNLRSQSTAGACPECGRPVRDMLDFPRLTRSAPRWITSLRDSVAIALAAAATAMAAALTRDRTLSFCLGAAAWGLIWFAVWFLTRPEPGRLDRATRFHGRYLRLTVSAPFLAMIFLHPDSVAGQWFRELPDNGRFAMLALLFVAGFASIPATFLFHGILRRAAARLPSHGLAKQASFLSVVLPFTMFASLVNLVVLGRNSAPVTYLLLGWPMPIFGSIGESCSYGRLLFGGVQSRWELRLTLMVIALTTFYSIVVLVQFLCAFTAAARRAEARRTKS